MLKGKSHKELLKLCQSLVQPLLPNFYKGQAGKVCVIGGCQDYTGAPYFAAHASAAVGSDLTHIICETKAAQVIKSYSPDLMVHPYLYDENSANLSKSNRSTSSTQLPNLLSNSTFDEFIDTHVMPQIVSLLNRIDIVVIGPGFGRDDLMLASLVKIVQEVKVLNKPLIIDADGLYLVSMYPELIQNYSKAILTPNVNEFNRLKQSLKLESTGDDAVSDTIMVAKNLGCTVIQKGKSDIIANGQDVLVNESVGSLRRVGGQGDTLVGVMSTFVNWSNNYIQRVWEHPDEVNQQDANLLAIYSASVLVRAASNKAFKKHGRSMQTSIVHEFLHDAYYDLFETDSRL
jgi:ATP-dependent NAD(P)H-hydrate dehydratase